MAEDTDRNEMEGKVREDVERLLKQFAEKIKDFDENDASYFIDRDASLRSPEDNEDNKQEDSKSGFKDRILKNAPSQDGDYIIAEKKGW